MSLEQLQLAQHLEHLSQQLLQEMWADHDSHLLLHLCNGRENLTEIVLDLRVFASVLGIEATLAASKTR